MKILADYHTHTYFSDAKDSPEEMVKAAVQKGIKEIAITDHGYASYILGLSRTSQRRQAEILERLREHYPEIKILTGIESNLLDFEGRIDMDAEDFKNFDIVQFGFHRPVRFWMVKDLPRFIIRNIGIFKQDIDRNTTALIKAMERYPIKILSHLNNIFKVHVGEVAKEAVKRGVRLELNEKHWSDLEPHLDEAIAAGADFILGSDSHFKDRVGRFDNVLKMIEKHGIEPARIKGLGD